MDAQPWVFRDPSFLSYAQTISIEKVFLDANMGFDSPKALRFFQPARDASWFCQDWVKDSEAEETERNEEDSTADIEWFEASD